MVACQLRTFVLKIIDSRQQGLFVNWLNFVLLGFALHGSVFLKICCLYMIDRILRLRRNFELESV